MLVAGARRGGGGRGGGEAAGRGQRAGGRRAGARASAGRAGGRPAGGAGARLQPPAGGGHVPTARTSCRGSRPCSTCSRSARSPRSMAPDTFVRPIYAGNALATVRSADRKQVHDRARGELRPGAGRGRQRRDRGGRRSADVPSPGRFVSAELSRSERPELTAARVVISGGRGMQQRREFQAARRRSPTSSARPSAPAARRSMRASFPTTTRSGRPARSSRRTCISRSAFPAPSSTLPA